jgi:PIN domain nuclease of toxin-antitoxin system
VIVLDSSAILAVLLNEPERDFVLERIQGSFATIVTDCEAIGVMVRNKADAQAEANAILELGVRIVPVSLELAIEAAAMIEKTQFFGLSLGDRLCIGLGRAMDAEILTGDRVWTRVDLGARITLIC